jgi:hypothetical protein
MAEKEDRRTEFLTGRLRLSVYKMRYFVGTRLACRLRTAQHLPCTGITATRRLDMRKTTITLIAAISGLFLAAGMASAQAQALHHRHHKGSVTGVTGNDATALDCTNGVMSTGDDDDNSGFTNASFSGTYADSFNGPATTPAPGAITGTGVLTADGNGTITSGTETVSDGTNVCHGTLTGTYAIRADGTGAMCVTFMIDPTGPIAGNCTSPAMSVVALVIQSPSSISTSEADASTLVISGNLRLQSGNGGGGGEGGDGD